MSTDNSKSNASGMDKKRIIFGGVAISLWVGFVIWRQWEKKKIRERTYDWLESILGKESLTWVKKRNSRTLEKFGKPDNNESQNPVHQESHALYTKMLAALNNEDKIPYAKKIGDHIYNFWQDTEHVRGIWRRTTLADYKNKNPTWEPVLDLDELNKTENKSLVWKGSVVLKCPGESEDRVLLRLSPGGSDAVVVREFDLTTCKFVSENAFNVSVAKTDISWVTRDSVYIGTDFGEGSLTTSGYPRITKLWKRGTPLSDAKIVYEGKTDDLCICSSVDYDHGHTYTWNYRVLDFYNTEYFCLRGTDFVKVDVPTHMKLSTFSDQLLFEPRKDWEFRGETYVKGSLLALQIDDFFTGDGNMSKPTILFNPDERTSLQGHNCLKTYVMLEILKNVKCVQEFWKYEDGKWSKEKNIDHGMNTANSWCYHGDDSDQYWMTVSSYLKPTQLHLCDANTNKEIDGSTPLKSLPELFNSKNLHVEQMIATSKDGTKIPYFCTSPTEMKRDKSAPTILYGYGGFEISLTPSYQAMTGLGWLEKGNHVFVTANIRGGGEFGPKWHQAALKEKRHKAYEDFAAVARDLVDKGITSPHLLGIWGGSNGGLLMGNMLTTYPNLFGAIVCTVPLLDMKRYTHLLAGASWMAEYGNPDIPEQWEYLKKYSPFHNVDPVAKYPPILLSTSTKDDRVHPAHARKMTKKLMDLDKPDVYYYENMEGGHSSGADNKQTAFSKALCYTFLSQMLK